MLLAVALAKGDEGLRLGVSNERTEALATIVCLDAVGSMELGLACLEALTVASLVELDTAGSACLDLLTAVVLVSLVPDSEGWDS